MDDYDLILNKVISQIEKNNFYSHDPYDVLGSSLILKLRNKKNNMLNSLTNKEPTLKDKIIRKIFSPIYQTTYAMSIYRFLFGIKEVAHPKSYGLMLQTYLSNFRRNSNIIFLEKAKKAAQWLMTNTDQHNFGKYCWGLPWIWPSEVNIPAYGPQSTMSAVIGLGFVELYEATKDDKYLEVAISVCKFFEEDLNIDKISDDMWALSYTPYDKTHVLNVNLHCAALLLKVWEHTNNKNFYDFAIKIANFTMNEQREDGAWHYSSKLDGYINAVDNTHTGDNLEYLTIMKKVMKNNFSYEEQYKKGILYYLKYFISEDGKPHYTDKEIYPIESHPACQMLITLSLLTDYNKNCKDKASLLIKWIINNLMNKKKDRIYYRIYDTGFIDKSYSISWGDAWLAKGISLYLENLEKIKE
jgi:hypothetical protein